MELMTPHIGTIFWTTVTFILLAFILYKVAWNPILDLLENREQRIKDSLSTADRAREEAEQRKEEHEQLIQEARQKANEIIAASRAQGEQLRDEIVKKAQAESDKMVQRAKKEIDASRDKAMKDMRKLAVELTITATQKLVGKTLNEQDHKRLIREAIENTESLN